MDDDSGQYDFFGAIDRAHRHRIFRWPSANFIDLTKCEDCCEVWVREGWDPYDCEKCRLTKTKLAYEIGKRYMLVDISGILVSKMIELYHN
jgi:hypothetical protein